MPRRRGIERAPRDYVAAGEWPDGRLAAGAPDVVSFVAELVGRLRDAIGSRSIRDVARAADLQHTTLNALLRGERIPDVATVYKLEVELDADLWPRR